MQQLFDSQVGAAAVVDQHINVPFQVQGAIHKAILRTATVPFDLDASGQPAGGIRTDWAMRFVINYIGVRWTAGKEFRDDTIIKAYDNGLDPAPASFSGW